MLEKIKNLGNLPLVIILIVVVIVAIVLSIFKAQNTEEANADTYVSDTTKKEEIKETEENENEQEPIGNVIIDAENIEEEDNEEVEEEENVDAKYFIRVNYGQNVVTIYTKDSNGKYTVPYKAMICSTGTATPRSGTYTIPGSGTKWPRGVWGMMIGNVWAQYFTRIKGSILFHSVPYTEQNKWSLEYWEYDKLGTAASAGCIRLTVEDAKWIYNNCPAGTKVEFYSDSNPGPLGKPTAQKISEEEAVRGWDPTDPDSANPWKTYNSEDKEEKEEDKTTDKPTKPSKPTTPEETPDKNPEEPETPTDKPEIPDSGNSSGEEQEGGGSNGEGTGEETNPDLEGSTGQNPSEEEKPNQGESGSGDNLGENNGESGETPTPGEDSGSDEPPTTPEPNPETEQIEV